MAKESYFCPFFVNLDSQNGTNDRLAGTSPRAISTQEITREKHRSLSRARHSAVHQLRFVRRRSRTDLRSLVSDVLPNKICGDPGRPKSQLRPRRPQLRSGPIVRRDGRSVPAVLVLQNCTHKTGQHRDFVSRFLILEKVRLASLPPACAWVNLRHH